MTAVAEKPTLSAADYFRAKLSYEITPFSLNNQLPEGKHVVVDMRDKEKWELERVPGALNIPLKDLASRMKELPQDKTIVPYCSNIICGLAVRGALQLAEKGFSVQMMYGGLEAWKKNFPVEGKGK